MHTVEIRLATEKDVPSILAIYSPFILNSSTSFEIEVPDDMFFWKRIEVIQEESPWLVCIIEGELVGYAYACAHRSREAYRRSRELSVYISDKHQRKGIALALYTSLIELIKIQGFTNALAGIVLPNESSIAFHEKLGFEKIGLYRKVGFKNNRFHDVAWYQLFIADENEMLPLKSMHDLMLNEKTKKILLEARNQILIGLK